MQNNNVASTNMDADSLFAVMDNANPAHIKSLCIDFHTEKLMENRECLSWKEKQSLI